MNIDNFIPDWVDCEAKPNEGLDLLGLRNPVQRIGNRILNGITSITPAIRYLGLRSWIIWRFAQSKLPLNEFRDFSYRVECAIVLGNLLAGEKPSGLIGSQKAQEFIESGKVNLLLERLVKSQTAMTVYKSACEDLGLGFDSENDVPGITIEFGEPLAKIIENQVKDTAFTQKLKENPKLSKSTREELLEFGKQIYLHDINKEEIEMLLKAITTNHNFESYKTYCGRIATYGLLLSISKEMGSDFNESDLFELCLQPRDTVPALLHPYLDEWLCYLIRDMIAVVHEAALWELIETVKTLTIKNTNTTLEETKNKYLSNEKGFRQVLKQIGIRTRSKDIRSMSFVDFYNEVDELIGWCAISEGNLCRWKNSELDELKIIKLALESPDLAVALIPIAWIIAKKRTENSESDARIFMLSEDGTDRIGLGQVILPCLQRWKNEDFTLLQVWSHITDITLQQHLRITYNRMRLDANHDVTCIYYSEDKITFKQDLIAGRILSRLRQAIGWLFQLDLIDDKGITKSGEACLNSIIQKLQAGDANEST